MIPLSHPPVISRTDDVEASLELAIEARLEVSDEPAPLLALWGAFEGDRMVGTASLNILAGLPGVGRIAVADDWRGQGLGRRLLATLEADARLRGITTLWATARAPGFFLANGYAVVREGPDAARLLADCASCRQYRTACRPEVVSKGIKP